jgi:hypothetical protein
VQRLSKILVALMAIGLVSLSGSLLMARGGGGGHGGGHGGAQMARSGGNSGSRIVNRTNPNNFKQSQKSHSTSTKKVVHPRGPKPPKTGNNGRRPRRKPRYHMHYPAGFWFDGDLDDGDADVAAGGIDVQFASIRQLDAGDPAKNLAPAYRVWFTNNSDVDIDQPFDVAILASSDEALTLELPYASVRVDGIAAGESASVDIRLPIEAMSMGDDSQAYTFVHTIVDSQKELVETNKSNNLSVYNRESIPALEE